MWPSLSLSTLTERQLKGFLSELLNSKHYSYLYSSFQICTPNGAADGQFSFSASHKTAIWYQTNTCICCIATHSTNAAIISAQQEHPVSFYPREGKETDRQTDRQTDNCILNIYGRSVLSALVIPTRGRASIKS